MDIQDTLHYTFSTIPQVLSAIIALLGVFWVYKISESNKRLKSQAEVLKREIDPGDYAKKHYFERVKKYLIDNLNYTEFNINRLQYQIASSIDQENFE